MNTNDRKEFSRVLAGLATVFRVELTAEAIDIYFGAARDWTLDDFKAAASYLARTSQWMPKPRDFEQIKRAHETNSSEAWLVVESTCVHWRNPELLPTGRIARAAQVVGGFREIALADRERELPWKAKRFREAYDELTEVETVREALPQIAPSEHARAITRAARALVLVAPSSR
jgi:hypothetical protein